MKDDSLDQVTMNVKLRKKIILSDEPDATGDVHIRSKTTLDEVIDWQDIGSSPGIESQHPEVTDQPRKPKRRGWLTKILGPLSLVVLVLSSIELLLFIRAMYLSEDWLSGLWLVVAGLILSLAIGALISEWQGLRQLKRQQKSRQTSLELFNTPAIGLGRIHCMSVAKRLPEHYQGAITSWQNSLKEHHTDSEIISLFEHIVIAEVDKRALANVMSNATAASVMIAVSPFALLDMAIVLWRNVRMMNQISATYGVRLGYWGRVALIRRIFQTMLYAGAAEIISDAGNYAIGASVTGKLSTRIAQGMGAGVLTARIGLKAIHECRPLPWLSVQKPGLSQISKKLVTDLHNRLK